MADTEARLSEVKMRAAERAHDSGVEFYNRTNEAAVSTGSLAVKTAVLINGGAAVALLAFIGGLFKENTQHGPHLIAVTNSLVWFIVGVVLGIISIATSYLANYFAAIATVSRKPIWEFPYFEKTEKSEWYQRLRKAIEPIVIGSAALSILAFVCGMVQVHSALIRMGGSEMNYWISWMPAHPLTAFGLGLGMVGVAIIFKWGPIQPDFQDYIALSLEDSAEGDRLKSDVARKKRVHRLMSSGGLVLIFVGFTFQLIDAWR